MYWIVGQGANHPRLFPKGLIANQLHWVDRKGPICGTALCGKNSLSPKPIFHVSYAARRWFSQSYYFDEPQKAVTPGQFSRFFMQISCV